MPKLGALVLRRQLGTELRSLRTRANVSRERAAGLLDCAVSRIGHIENGRNAIRKLELDALAGLYGATPGEHEHLEDLRKKASQPRRSPFDYRLPAPLKLYAEMELAAATMRGFEVELIPGLLQTEEYARQVHLVAGPLYGDEEIERLIAARKHRQVRLTDDEEPLNYSVIVSEAAFRRALGDPRVGPAQLAHVAEMARLPNVALQVLPFADPDLNGVRGGLHPSMSGSFAVLTFAHNVAPPFAYQEHAIGGHIVDDQEIVQRLVDIWDLLCRQALPPDESQAWLSGLL